MMCPLSINDTFGVIEGKKVKKKKEEIAFALFYLVNIYGLDKLSRALDYNLIITFKLFSTLPLLCILV